MHKSIKLDNPCEFINITPLNPLISKCQIKVCYVGEEPNRNRSIITREVAMEMANSLPGSPIVGYYNEDKEDFEGHNKIIDISNGKFQIKDTTRPYGFVDLNAKVWFQKFLDDDAFEREYLMTEGWLWTGQYPECQRIIDQGNNQSMELDEKTLDAHWSKDFNGNAKFFIINEAVISKLCILGEEVEPCFEGASISQVQFSFEDSFKTQLFEMMTELKELLKGGTKDMENIDETLVQEPEVIEETPVIETEETEIVEEPEVIEETPEVTEEPAAEETPAAEFAEDKGDDEEVCPECGKPTDECECDEEEDKKEYSLDQIPEYVELLEKYNTLVADYSSLEATNVELVEFKSGVELKEKQAMIASFYMLSDEDKADVTANINTYSLDEIESKLSVICVRNKVNFNLEEETEENPVVYNVNNGELNDDEGLPAWVKAVKDTEKNLNN